MVTDSKITYEQFQSILKKSDIVKEKDYSYLYDVYSYAIEGIEELFSNSDIITISRINHIELISYVMGEFIYSTMKRNEEDIESFKKEENILTSMASVVADKYLSLTEFSFSEKRLTHKYLPPISSLYSYINFILNVLNSYRTKNDDMSIISDMFFKAMSISKCTLDLLIDGFETEAFSSWRTLHECECSLIILTKYKDIALPSYVRHMTYGMAFKDMIENKDRQTTIFNNMKEEMRKYDLKSKDIKKFIEYGWLLVIPEFDITANYKLNFRDGPQRLADLSEYAKRYETSSEIIHNTPLLIYSNKEYFYYTTLLSLYESFFRLEEIFMRLFFERVNEDAKKKYIQMRKIYYSQLSNIYLREQEEFERWKTK